MQAKYCAVVIQEGKSPFRLVVRALLIVAHFNPILFS